jgi:hypothetical protein
VKSHPDVGERWYPDLLAKIREKEALMDNKVNQTNGEKPNGTNRVNGHPVSAPA